MINPDHYPPIPASIVPELAVLPATGDRVEVVTIPDAARLIGRTQRCIEDWITEGKIKTCRTPDQGRRILVESLWLALPVELRR